MPEFGTYRVRILTGVDCYTVVLHIALPTGTRFVKTVLKYEAYFGLTREGKALLARPGRRWKRLKCTFKMCLTCFGLCGDREVLLALLATVRKFGFVKGR